ncbi:MAG: TIGR03746 family integrating conjugative element protein [Alteromonadaceae bacterium]|nr:TIGR03746 family integrating conjugative element protein [Alteromonadaceae bacterium]
MSKAKKESDRKDKVIRSLTIFVLLLLGLVAHSHFLLATLAKEFECHFPPDLSKGGMVKVNEFQKHELYAFAYKITQQLYRCEADCSVDFGANIRNYGYFLTDNYRPKLLAKAKKLEGYNRRRVRSVTEFGRFSENKVVALGAQVWIVYLDLEEKEHIGGKLVRHAYMRYPLIITKFDVDRERNPWRLAIDGFQGQPERLK